MTSPITSTSSPEVYAALIESLLNIEGHITDEDLLKLHHFFGPLLIPALTLVDKGDVIKISLPNGRSIYQVSSSTSKPYTIHPTNLHKRKSYCPCVAFINGSIMNGGQLMCKHLLAVRLAEATGRCRKTVVGREGVAALLGM